MLDIVEGAKIMFGGAATGSAASKYGDWINMENFTLRNGSCDWLSVGCGGRVYRMRCTGLYWCQSINCGLSILVQHRCFN